jgi:hypothetical protein
MALKKNTMSILQRPKCNLVYSLNLRDKSRLVYIGVNKSQIFVNISHFWNKSQSFFSLLIMIFCIFLTF